MVNQSKEKGLWKLLKNLPGQTKEKSTQNIEPEPAPSEIIKGKDPFQALPDEVLLLVLGNLSYGQVVGILRVSRLWNSKVSSLEILTTTLDFSNSRTDELSREAIQAAIRRLDRSKGLRHLVLNQIQPSTAQLIGVELDYGVNWTSMKRFVTSFWYDPCFESVPWHEWTQLKVLEIGSARQMQPWTILGIMRTCTTLQSCKIDCILMDEASHGEWLMLAPVNEHLDVLDLGFDGYRRPNVQLPTVWPYPNLRKLRLHNALLHDILDLSECHKLSELDVLTSQCHWLHKFDGPPNINVLRTMASNIPSPYSYGRRPSWNISILNLRSLHLSGNSAETALSTLVSPGGLPTAELRHLRIEGVSTSSMFPNSVNENPIEHIFTNLESLIIDGGSEHYLDAKAYARFFPNIQHLEFNANLASDEFISGLIKRPNNRIKTLDFKYADRVRKETLDRARARGISVRVRQSQYH